MDVTRWRQLEEVFHAVVDLPPGSDRLARISALCGPDEALAAEVGQLLAEDERLQSAEPPVDPHVGLRLGSYQVDRLIARGGMAAVYEAHRADDQFHQRVAIKIMDLRLSDPALVAQFKAERQILAALEHPGLTRLLDGGVTSLGEPYLVMEYVEGQPIDQYCDAHRLDIAARVGLFIDACRGVTFAHRNLVLHRDLKPSNILVTTDGHAKVVDFGTATLLQPERLATVSLAPLTPAYASPEQLTGQPVATASDQYSLGLVLYELLTGVAPFASRASIMAAIERALAGVEPTAPHDVVTDASAVPRRTSTSRLRRQLAGDLGTIVRKTLAVNPAARYPSVEHAVDDLERWTRGEAILGRTPSLTYRASRFVSRHWAAVSIAAVLLLSLAAATIFSTRQAAIARAESGKARQLNRFLTQMLSSANPTWVNANAANAGSITVRQVLDGASELIGGELGANPEVEAEMRRTLGRTYLGLGSLEQARPHLERALTLYVDQQDEFGVAFTRMLLGERLLVGGDFKGAEAYLRDALVYVRARGEQVDAELHQITTNDLAVALGSQSPGSPESVALLQESVAASDRSGLNAGGASVAVSNLGYLAYRAGRLDEAERLLRDSLRRMENLKTRPPERGMALNYLSNVLFTQERYVEAEQVAAESVAQAAGQWPADHPYVPGLKGHWARTLARVGRLTEARALGEEALAGYRKQRPAGHPDLVSPMLTLGLTARLEGRLADAEGLQREAIAITRQHPQFTDRAAQVAGELGLTLRARGRTAEADALLKESHGILLKTLGEAHPLTKQALERLNGAG